MINLTRLFMSMLMIASLASPSVRAEEAGNDEKKSTDDELPITQVLDGRSNQFASPETVKAPKVLISLANRGLSGDGVLCPEGKALVGFEDEFKGSVKGIVCQDALFPLDENIYVSGTRSNESGMQTCNMGQIAVGIKGAKVKTNGAKYVTVEGLLCRAYSQAMIVSVADHTPTKQCIADTFVTKVRGSDLFCSPISLKPYIDRSPVFVLNEYSCPDPTFSVSFFDIEDADGIYEAKVLAELPRQEIITSVDASKSGDRVYYNLALNPIGAMQCSWIHEFEGSALERKNQWRSRFRCELVDSRPNNISPSTLCFRDRIVK